MKIDKLYRQMIEEEKQKLSNEALFSAERQLKKVRWIQLRWSLFAIFLFIALILFSFFQSTPPKRSFIDNLPASSMSVILVLGALLIVTLLVLLQRQTNRGISKYVEQGLIEEQDVGYNIKPRHTGRGYLFLRKDRLVYIDNIKNEVYKEIMYEDVRLVIYEELIIPYTRGMPKIPIRELLICLYTNKEAYVFSTTGLIKMPALIKSVVASSMNDRASFMNGRLLVEDIASIGIKTYYSRLGIPFWLTPYILLPVSILVIIFGIVFIASALDFILS